MTVEEFFDQVITVRMREDRSSLDIIDQTLLPGTIKRIHLNTKEEIWEAIKKLRVRGAPAIGAAAAYGIALLASGIAEDQYDAFYSRFKELKDYLASSRPTAVNLFWALNRMEAAVIANKERGVAAIKELLFEEADRIREEDIQISRGIGEIGFGLLKELKKEGKEIGILTHCNAGTLATAKYGTATAPMYIALEKGWAGTDMHVYCDETRPLLQGARLTSFELYNAGITTTLQCDNMASILMKSGKIDIIFVGCDRVARNGDAANKIGTSGVAILAKHYGIPFYVCAPTSTIDMDTLTGDQIPIEMRSPDEVTEMWYKERMAPEGINVYNPAFDVTDHSLITGIITEKGMCHAPYAAEKNHINIRCDGHRATDMLDAILQLMPLDGFVEKPVTIMDKMEMHRDLKCPVWDEFTDIVAKHDERGADAVGFLDRFAFYDAAKDAYAVVSTSETAFYACIMIQKGCL